MGDMPSNPWGNVFFTSRNVLILRISNGNPANGKSTELGYYSRVQNVIISTLALHRGPVERERTANCVTAVVLGCRGAMGGLHKRVRTSAPLLYILSYIGRHRDEHDCNLYCRIDTLDTQATRNDQDTKISVSLQSRRVLLF